ncbi:MAG: VWA domain-containing protein [Anaerolineae bacterium]|nr:VWA domain-containing protein [Anaerolineae bacterium]
MLKRYVLVLLAAFVPLLSGCDVIDALSAKRVTVSIVYGSEKEEWLEPLVEAFNEAKHRTAAGSVIEVEATPMGSIESAEQIVAGQLQPTVWSPASSIYIPVANAAWRSCEHAEDLVEQDPPDLVLSPVVIAMWEPMARALGWPEKSLGWSDIANMAMSDDGWAAYGYPEWGSFKFGHTHPNFSNSGLVSVIAEAYAGTGKQRNLALEDLASPALKEFMTRVESGVIHYGTSTGFFATRMFERGPSYLSAAVMYENLVVAQESKRLAGESAQLPVVAIYPREGTFWSNHPYAILNAPWVDEEERAAAEIFGDYLLDRPQQLSSVALGFRPADLSIKLAAPLDAQHGVDPTQPQTVLAVPPAEIISAIQKLWREVKKPVDLVVAMDISGSMGGDKIVAARASLVQFIDLLDDRDRLQIILFNKEMVSLTPLTPLGSKRAEVKTRVSGIVEGGNTLLYESVQAAYRSLEEQGDPKHIRAMVILSDGADTASNITLRQLRERIASQSEAGDATKIFAIAFGQDADRAVLREIAETTGGREYEGDPETIYEVYAKIATFF